MFDCLSPLSNRNGSNQRAPLDAVRRLFINLSLRESPPTHTTLLSICRIANRSGNRYHSVCGFVSLCNSSQVPHLCCVSRPKWINFLGGNLIDFQFQRGVQATVVTV